MGHINSFSGIVKILEKPNQIFINEQITLTTLRAELPQSRNEQVLTLHFWGNLGRDSKIYYQPQDYLLIEGYSSIRKKTNLNVSYKNPKQTILTVLKVYPLVLHGIKSGSKV